MTEEEWVNADMQEVRRATAQLGARRQRLLAGAICRSLGTWIDYPEAHAALEIIEAFADTGKTKAALRRARQSLVQLRRDLHDPPPDITELDNHPIGLALFVIQVAASENAVGSTAEQAAEVLMLGNRTTRDAALHQLYTPYQEVAGPPTPVAFDPAWRTSTAVALATQMYDSRDFAIMPILGDALKDAGCDHDDILAHCRDPQGTHARGCWVVDLVLGKS